MIEIAIILSVCLAIGKWLKTREWYPNSAIPAGIIVLAIALNLLNAFLFGGDILEAGRDGFIQAIFATGLHSATKNATQRN
jgi:hypothetical protein